MISLEKYLLHSDASGLIFFFKLCVMVDMTNAYGEPEPNEIGSCPVVEFPELNSEFLLQTHLNFLFRSSVSCDCLCALFLLCWPLLNCILP